MNQFPEDFCKKYMKRLEDSDDDETETQIALKEARKTIVDIVRNDRERYRPASFFYISYSGRVMRCSSIEDLRSVNRCDNTRQYAIDKLCNETRNKHNFIVKQLSAELNQRFGIAFKTVHHTRWDVEADKLFTINERPATPLCCIEFE